MEQHTYQDNYSSEEQGPGEETSTQFLTFIVGDETYGVEVGNVREVINYERVFAVPLVPEYIRGVINLRGEVVPIIDLSFRFYRRKSVESKMTSIVIMEIESDGDVVHIGAVIDAINAVLDIPASMIEHAPEFGSKIRHDFIYGVGKTEEQFIIILNVAKALDVAELSDFISAIQ